MSHYYTGVGSRQTPSEVLKVMQELAKYLAKRGLVLRSGAANGADTAFEEGCDSIDPHRKQIFVPWKGFNGRAGFETGVVLRIDPECQTKAAEIASHIHPAWERLSQGAKTLHTRNVYQVLGPDVQTPSRFLVCWAPVGKNEEPKGGTRTAVMIARQAGIRTYNLALDADLRHIQTLLGSTTSE
jgi:hypothetical protein